MKKTLLTLFTLCTVFQFTNAQLAIDTNSTCNKSTLVIASNIYHPTYDRFDNTKNKAYYSFVATSTNAKLIVKSKVFIYYVWVDTLCTFNNMGIYQGDYYKGVYSVNIPLDNLKIGKKYLYQIGKYDSGIFESGILNISQPEDLPKKSKAILQIFHLIF